MERHHDALVVGAGISGLTAARLFARAGLRTCVLEAEPRAGGALHSARLPLGQAGYWVELGAHTLFNSYHSLLTLFPELELDRMVVRRRNLPFRLWHDGKAQSIGGALHWGELLRNVPHAFGRKREGQRASDWFGAVAGRRNYAEVIGPSLDALLCQPAAEFPADLLFKQRPRVRAYPRSFSLQGGLGSLPHRLAHGFELRTSTPVLRLGFRDGVMRCETPSGDFLAGRLLLAVPVSEAVRLLAPVAPEVAAPVAAIPLAELDSTAVALEAEVVGLPPLAGMVARDAPWYSMVSRDVVSDGGIRAFTFHFRPGLDDDGRTDAVAKALHVKSAAFLATAHAHHRLPGLRLGHAARIEALDRGLATLPIGIAGNYFGGLSIEDCAARAAREAQRLLRAPPVRA